MSNEGVDMVWAHRATFQQPLTRVNAGLRYYVTKANAEIVIAQRMKRLPRIIQKLTRFPNMRLTQMQDVGGCRAVLPSQTVVQQVLAGIGKNWEVITVDDYVTNTPPTGYRAVHVIVRKDGVPIEVQLRTFGQQDWADEVERIDGLVPYALKDGEGPDEVLEYTRLLADVIVRIDAGELLDPQQAAALSELRSRVP